MYLAVFLNSLAGLMQVAQRLLGSSGQIELYSVDLAQFTIWFAPKDVHDKIRNAVKESFAGLQRATQLLDVAKRAVEIAIEQSEVAALAYLKAAHDPHR